MRRENQQDLQGVTDGDARGDTRNRDSHRADELHDDLWARLVRQQARESRALLRHHHGERRQHLRDERHRHAPRARSPGRRRLAFVPAPDATDRELTHRTLDAPRHLAPILAGSLLGMVDPVDVEQCARRPRGQLHEDLRENVRRLVQRIMAEEQQHVVVGGDGIQGDRLEVRYAACQCCGRYGEAGQRYRVVRPNCRHCVRNREDVCLSWYVSFLPRETWTREAPLKKLGAVTPNRLTFVPD